MSEPFLSSPQPTNEQLRIEIAELRRQLEEAEYSRAISDQLAEESARQAERRLDAFLSKLAHDMRNPLTPIHNAVEILKLLDRGDADRRRAVDIIDGQVRVLRGLLTEVLDLSRIVCAKIDLKKQPVLLANIVAAAVERNKALMAQHKHQLTVALPPDPAWVMGDASRLTQIIANLLENAAKYTAEGGQIQISAANVGDEIVCRVVDNGSGIDARTLPRIFDLFANAERTLNEARPGLGVGLTISRKLATMHGGSIQARSAGPGRGSEFIVRLPRLADADRAEPEPAEPLIRQGKLTTRRILVVSSADFAEELGMLLRLSDHETRTAHNAADALEMAKRFRPDVVAVEIDLPRLEAEELARQLHALPGLEKSLLIAISASGAEKSRQLASTAPWHAHLVKPMKIRDLLRLIAT